MRSENGIKVILMLQVRLGWVGLHQVRLCWVRLRYVRGTLKVVQNSVHYYDLVMAVLNYKVTLTIFLLNIENHTLGMKVPCTGIGGDQSSKGKAIP